MRFKTTLPLASFFFFCQISSKKQAHLEEQGSRAVESECLKDLFSPIKYSKHLTHNIMSGREGKSRFRIRELGKNVFVMKLFPKILKKKKKCDKKKNLPTEILVPITFFFILSNNRISIVVQRIGHFV